MQPDGTLNPSAEPREEPDPSDSADSYWLARTIWALGEGYAAFADADPDFASFLADRLDLALEAVDRHVLSLYGDWLDIDGTRVPAWLIADGADATGEALLGLAAYVGSTRDKRARRSLAKLAEGVAAMRAGDSRTWPFGAVLPWALSRAVWHAWGGLAPAGLAAAYECWTTGNCATPHSLTRHRSRHTFLSLRGHRTDGCQLRATRCRSPMVRSRGSNLCWRPARPGTVPCCRRSRVSRPRGSSATTPSGTPMYDPTTGRTFDGVEGQGNVNRNSGAESTIHGLLAMLALDDAPDVAAIARTAQVTERATWRLVEAESGTLSGDATLHQPASAWTGESLWSAGAGVRLGPGGALVLDAPISEPSVLMAAIELSPDAGVTGWSVGTRDLGRVDHNDVGAQGDSPAPGLLAISTLRRTTDAGEQVTVTGQRGTSIVDALLIQPEVERLVLEGDGHGTALLRSFAAAPRNVNGERARRRCRDCLGVRRKWAHP